MVVTNGSKESASPWIWCPINREYCLSADFDNRWRTGGTVDEVYEEAHLSPHYIFEGIKRFVNEKSVRTARMKNEFPK
jgi:transketolase